MNDKKINQAQSQSGCRFTTTIGPQTRRIIKNLSVELGAQKRIWPTEREMLRICLCRGVREMMKDAKIPAPIFLDIHN
jgi:hypothetical protein